MFFAKGGVTMGTLDGKVALITGGAQGQGAVEARLFVEEGAAVVISDILEDEGRAVAEELGDAARFVKHDISDEAQWKDTVGQVCAAFGKMNILVNNAGVLSLGFLEETSVDEFTRVWRINQLGCFLGMRTAIAPMRDAGGGSIVNISSNCGMFGIAGMLTYTSTKWAIRGMTKVAAMELGQYGIRVNSVHPGPIETPMTAHRVASKDGQASFARQPIPRIGQPIEVARLVRFLASDEASYCTGAEYSCDGGQAAGQPFKLIPGQQAD